MCCNRPPSSWWSSITSQPITLHPLCCSSLLQLQPPFLFSPPHPPIARPWPCVLGSVWDPRTIAPTLPLSPVTTDGTSASLGERKRKGWGEVIRSDNLEWRMYNKSFLCGSSHGQSKRVSLKIGRSSHVLRSDPWDVHVTRTLASHEVYRGGRMILEYSKMTRGTRQVWFWRQMAS